MLDIHQKRKIRGVMYHRFTLLAIFLVFLIVLHSTWSVYEKKRESESLMNASKNHVAELLDRDKELRNKIQRLDTEIGIEEEIRSKFSVTKEDETMVIVVPEEENKVTQTDNTESIWQKIKKLFGR